MRSAAVSAGGDATGADVDFDAGGGTVGVTTGGDAGLAGGVTGGVARTVLSARGDVVGAVVVLTIGCSAGPQPFAATASSSAATRRLYCITLAGIPALVSNIKSRSSSACFQCAVIDHAANHASCSFGRFADAFR